MTKERAEIANHVEVTLKELFDVKFQAMEKAFDLFREVVEERLKQLNAVRQQHMDDRSQFVRRELHDTLQAEVSSVKNMFGKFTIVAVVIIAILQLCEPIALYFIFRR
jgi:CHASE3 domain sensor protein